MFIKVNDGCKGCHLIDYVDKIYRVGKTYKIYSIEELNNLIELKELNPVNLIAKEAFNNKLIFVGIFAYRKNNADTFVIFTDTTFICNDRGDTIEKLFANARSYKEMKEL